MSKLTTSNIKCETIARLLFGFRFLVPLVIATSSLETSRQSSLRPIAEMRPSLCDGPRDGLMRYTTTK